MKCWKTRISSKNTIQVEITTKDHTFEPKMTKVLIFLLLSMWSRQDLTTRLLNGLFPCKPSHRATAMAYFCFFFLYLVLVFYAFLPSAQLLHYGKIISLLSPGVTILLKTSQWNFVLSNVRVSKLPDHASNGLPAPAQCCTNQVPNAANDATCPLFCYLLINQLRSTLIESLQIILVDCKISSNSLYEDSKVWRPMFKH